MNYIQYMQNGGTTQYSDAAYIHVPTARAVQHPLLTDPQYLAWTEKQEDPTVEKYLKFLEETNSYGGDLNDANLPASAHKHSPKYLEQFDKEQAELQAKTNAVMSTVGMLGGFGIAGTLAPMGTAALGASLGAGDYFDVTNVGSSDWNPGWKRTAEAYNDLQSEEVLDPTVFAGNVARDALGVVGMASPAIAAAGKYAQNQALLDANARAYAELLAAATSLNHTIQLNKSVHPANATKTSLAFYERPKVHISETELAGIPKGDRHQLEIIELLKKQNTANLKLYLSSNSRRIPDNMPNFGPQIGQMKRFLASKVDISQFSDEDILNLIKLRFVELNNSASGRFAMRASQSTYDLYTGGNNTPIGRVNFGDNGDGTIGIGMVSNYTSGPNAEKGISEDLYNLIINEARLNGMKGLSSGHDLRSPLATTKIWEKYPNKIILSETGGTHKINGINTPGPVVLLTEPSKPLVPLKSYLFDPSIIKDGQMIIDWNKGLYRKNGGELNYLNYFE